MVLLWLLAVAAPDAYADSPDAAPPPSLALEIRAPGDVSAYTVQAGATRLLPLSSKCTTQGEVCAYTSLEVERECHPDWNWPPETCNWLVYRATAFVVYASWSPTAATFEYQLPLMVLAYPDPVIAACSLGVCTNVDGAACVGTGGSWTVCTGAFFMGLTPTCQIAWVAAQGWNAWDGSAHEERIHLC